LASRIVSLCDAQQIAIRALQEEGDPEAPRSISLWVVELPRGLEAGTHQLLSRSSERGRSSRKRWFAAVTIHQEEQRGTALSAKDLMFSACRAGGPGGQNVNKVSSAVRAVHTPTGLSVKVSTERSQAANKRLALSRIEQRLRAVDESKEAKRQASQRAAHYQLIRGNPVSSYRCEDGALIKL
jgi:protein subunit release factor B